MPTASRAESPSTASTELFYDYRYDIHSAPEWAMESAARIARMENGDEQAVPAKGRKRKKGKAEKVAVQPG